jgi:hypothetical protein
MSRAVRFSRSPTGLDRRVGLLISWFHDGAGFMTELVA